MAQCLISKDNGKLQIPYAEYVSLMERLEDAERIMQVKNEVLTSLKQRLQGVTSANVPNKEKKPGEEKAAPVAAPEPHVQAEKVSVEFSANEPVRNETPAEPVAHQQKATLNSRAASNVEIPPIKKEIGEHFNTCDASGRLFNVFKQFYTCLNETCGGTVRVTMKDGVCSLWNYDEWEEFAFVDIHDEHLRFAVDPRYTNDLASLDFCEVSRLLASRRNLVSIQVGDLNKTMLSVLAKAFNEVGLAASS